jgi:AAA lid domain
VVPLDWTNALQAHAWLQGRDHVTPDDIRIVVNDCRRHRIGLSFRTQADDLTTDDIISKLLSLVPGLNLVDSPDTNCQQKLMPVNFAGNSQILFFNYYI